MNIGPPNYRSSGAPDMRDSLILALVLFEILTLDVEHKTPAKHVYQCINICVKGRRLAAVTCNYYEAH